MMMRDVRSRTAVALLITLFFIMAITVAVGVSLSQFTKGRETIDSNAFLLQSAAVMEDLLSLLKSAPMIKSVEGPVSLSVLLERASLIPLESDGVRVQVSLQSAHLKININALAGSKAYQEALQHYLARYNVQDSAYLLDLLIDCMEGKQLSYRTQIMDEMPWLYNERVENSEHLRQILDFYVKQRHDNSVNTVPWHELVRFSDHNDTLMDANYLSAEAWKFIFPKMAQDQLQTLDEHTQVYESLTELPVSKAQIGVAEAMGVGVYAPVIEVAVLILRDTQEATIRFEYSIESEQVRILNYDI